MNKEHINLLVCPRCHSRLVEQSSDEGNLENGKLVCTDKNHSFSIKNGIPRFVGVENYAESFGFQWNTFSQVQLDSYNGTRFSEERFRLITGWTSQDLSNKLILDAGCGAGRFAEVVLRDHARLVAFDLSGAVEAARDNLHSNNPLICQASIYELPFQQGLFDFVYCIGVIQHTPDPMASIRALSGLVKPGGQIGLWIYERDWKSYIGTLGFKFALRPLFARLSRSQQFEVCKALVRVFYPLASFCRHLGIVGKVIMRLLPIASAHFQTVPLSNNDFKVWVLLDTFDMYSPAYDQPQKYENVARILDECGFEKIQRNPHGGISVTATRRL